MCFPFLFHIQRPKKYPCQPDVMSLIIELLALNTNQTWDQVPHSVGALEIGSEWVSSIKVKSDGSLDRYKGSVVAH